MHGKYTRDTPTLSVFSITGKDVILNFSQGMHTFLFRFFFFLVGK